MLSFKGHLHISSAKKERVSVLCGGNSGKSVFGFLIVQPSRGPWGIELP